MNYKTLFGILAVIIGAIGYGPYIVNIFRGKNKPHAFSWLVWSVLSFIAFAGQLVSKGGAGIWVNGFAAVMCFFIFLLALWRGSRSFPLFDWLALIGAGVGLLMWSLTENPTTTIILITLIDVLGFVPTLRKSYSKPNEETLFIYAVNIFKYSLGVAALHEYSIATVLFSGAGAIEGGIVVLFLLFRRAQVKKAHV